MHGYPLQWTPTGICTGISAFQQILSGKGKGKQQGNQVSDHIKLLQEQEDQLQKSAEDPEKNESLNNKTTDKKKQLR